MISLRKYIYFKPLALRWTSTKQNILQIPPKKSEELEDKLSAPKTNEQTVNNLQDFTDLLETKIEQERLKITKFKKEYGRTKVGEITVAQLYGGMRGMLGFVCDTSNLDAEEGIRFRGFTLTEIQQKLPKAEGGREPLPEAMFWLLITGALPSKTNVEFLSKMWAENSPLPEYVQKIIDSLPKDMHPMTQFSIAVASLNKNSKFNRAYNENIPRSEYWKFILEDSMDLLAKLPSVAALIYNKTFKTSKFDYSAKSSLDWSANFAHMLGFNDHDFNELLRLYLSLHCDHEGGNVSAHACHLVGSTLTDPYLAFAAGLNGLAGPLHGLANQEVLKWLDELVKAKGQNASEQDIKDFCQDQVKQSGKVIPGYGHAVLRKTDPRFICQMEYAQRVIPHDPLVKLVSKVYKVVPGILKSLSKVSNPWPNVDAHSGVLLRHFGLNEASYYTVLFGVSRALGLMAQLIWSRALMLPIERPDTITTDLLMARAKANSLLKEKDAML
ncbi:probable citrate synthase 1, mitochondrial isoform X2 [Lucilia sericata]|uniref:probable citrate synthase 1, mitochondrial isoform X2 n=1 Tax=Lucilia sericata TaxID=13632 RepID=UPI0018A7EB02|nr:probable citrate synthase 1, mitochondrial isoform X2 [Lucilia sericata]